VAIDVTTDTGKVRVLIADMDEGAPILTDADVNAFLAIEGNNIKLAAATALDAIASSESLLSKALKTVTTTTNGPAVAADLRKHAASLREQAAAAIAADADEGGAYFGVVSFDPYPGNGAEGTERWGW
jgi:hypothetical protein